MKKPVFLFLLFCCLSLPESRAQTGFVLEKGHKQVDIPFEYSNNFIILTIRFNGILPLRFIFDTGAEFTILSKREFSDMFQLPYEQKFQVTGSDLNNPLTAYLVRNVRFDIPEKIHAPAEDILVLEEDYFRFEEYAGVQVDGIISANAFSNYIIKINYERRVLTLIERKSFKNPSDYQPMPVEVFHNKIYLRTQLNIQPETTVPVKLLIDTGAGLPLLLFTNTHPLLQPPPNAIISNIGMGLGGYLEGFTGRINQLNLPPFAQREIITYFQELDTSQTMGFLNQRNGLLGNSMLNHFNVILDYQNAIVWLKPNKLYKEKFLFDRSGINLIASGKDLNHFIVHNIVPCSPAEEADIRPGDQLLKVGHTLAFFLSLDGIQNLFLQKPGKKLKITLLRNGEKYYKTIVLRDLL